MRWNFILLSFLLCKTCFSQDPYLFIGTYTNGTSKGIYVYRFNTTTGLGSEISTIRAANPSYLCLSSDGRHLYATDENNNGGAVGAYAFEPTTGQLAFLNSQSSQGTCPCYVSTDRTGRWVFVANYCSGNLAALPVNSDGSLAPAAQTIQQYGKGKDTSRQESSHVHSTILSPNEKYLLEANLGTDQEHVYSFQPGETMPLQEAADSVVNLSAGTGPRHIIFHPSKPYVYIIGELNGTIDAFRFDSTSGKLTPFQKVLTYNKQESNSPGSADIHIRGDGKFLYATNRGNSNTIAVFAIRKNGELTRTEIVSVKGKHPRNFVIDPTDKFLLVANRDTDNVVIFSINPVSGKLKATGKEIHVPNPVCLKFLTN